jgi:hypothetical protein
VLPPPEAKDYLVRRRRRAEAEEHREAKTKKRQTVALLNDHEAVAVGTSLTLIPENLRDDQQKAVEAKLSEDPSYGQATWTGKSSRKALRWEHDGNESSPSLIVWRMLEELGFAPSGVHGPYFWRLPNGRSLWEEAEALEEHEKQGHALDETLSVASQTAAATGAAQSASSALRA